MPESLRVLILEDESADAELIVEQLYSAGFEPEWKRVQTEDKYLEGLDPAPDIILGGFALPGLRSQRALQLLQERKLSVPFIVVTDTLIKEQVTECIKAGAVDYISKDQLVRLGIAVQRAVERTKLQDNNYHVTTKLRQSEDLYRAVVENANDGIGIRSEGKWVFVNKAFLTIHGLKDRSEAIGRPAEYFILPEDWDHVKKMTQVRREGGASIYEYRIRRKDGDIRYVQTANVSVMYKEQSATLALIRNVTEQKRAIDALAISEERYRTVIQNIADAIIIIIGIRIVFVNKAALDIFGLKDPSKIVGSHIGHLIAPEDRAEVVEGILKRQQGLTQSNIQEYGFLRTDGTVGVAESTFMAMTYDEQSALLVVVRDITERTQSEIALRESEERYRDFVENTSELVQIVAPDGTLVYVNRAWRETLGYTEGEIEDLSIFDIIHPDSRVHCMELFQRVMAGERITQVDTSYLTKDGRTLLVEGSSSCQFKNGKPIATRGIFRDVTERKRKEQQEHELEALNRLFQSHIRQREAAQAALTRFQESLDAFRFELQGMATAVGISHQAKTDIDLSTDEE